MIAPVSSPLQELRNSVYHRFMVGAHRRLPPVEIAQQRANRFQAWSQQHQRSQELDVDLVRHWAVADLMAYQETSAGSSQEVLDVIRANAARHTGYRASIQQFSPGLVADGVEAPTYSRRAGASAALPLELEPAQPPADAPAVAAQSSPASTVLPQLPTAQEQSAARAIEQTYERLVTMPRDALDNIKAEELVRADIGSLGAIENPAQRYFAAVAMGDSSRRHSAYQGVLEQQFPLVAAEVAVALREEDRRAASRQQLEMVKSEFVLLQIEQRGEDLDRASPAAVAEVARADAQAVRQITAANERSLALLAIGWRGYGHDGYRAALREAAPDIERLASALQVRVEDGAYSLPRDPLEDVLLDAAVRGLAPVQVDASQLPLPMLQTSSPEAVQAQRERDVQTIADFVQEHHTRTPEGVILGLARVSAEVRELLGNEQRMLDLGAEVDAKLAHLLPARIARTKAVIATELGYVSAQALRDVADRQETALAEFTAQATQPSPADTLERDAQQVADFIHEYHGRTAERFARALSEAPPELRALLGNEARMQEIDAAVKGKLEGVLPVRVARTKAAIAEAMNYQSAPTLRAAADNEQTALDEQEARAKANRAHSAEALVRDARLAADFVQQNHARTPHGVARGLEQAPAPVRALLANEQRMVEISPVLNEMLAHLNPAYVAETRAVIAAVMKYTTAKEMRAVADSQWALLAQGAPSRQVPFESSNLLLVRIQDDLRGVRHDSNGLTLLATTAGDPNTLHFGVNSLAEGAGSIAIIADPREMPVPAGWGQVDAWWRLQSHYDERNEMQRALGVGQAVIVAPIGTAVPEGARVVFYDGGPAARDSAIQQVFADRGAQLHEATPQEWTGRGWADFKVEDDARWRRDTSSRLWPGHEDHIRLGTFEGSSDHKLEGVSLTEMLEAMRQNGPIYRHSDSIEEPYVDVMARRVEEVRETVDRLLWKETPAAEQANIASHYRRLVQQLQQQLEKARSLDPNWQSDPFSFATTGVDKTSLPGTGTAVAASPVDATAAAPAPAMSAADLASAQAAVPALVDTPAPAMAVAAAAQATTVTELGSAPTVERGQPEARTPLQPGDARVAEARLSLLRSRHLVYPPNLLELDKAALAFDQASEQHLGFKLPRDWTGGVQINLDSMHVEPGSNTGVDPEFFSVSVPRESGPFVVVGRFSDRTQADTLAQRLQWIEEHSAPQLLDQDWAAAQDTLHDRSQSAAQEEFAAASQPLPAPADAAAVSVIASQPVGEETYYVEQIRQRHAVLRDSGNAVADLDAADLSALAEADAAALRQVRTQASLVAIVTDITSSVEQSAYMEALRNADYQVAKAVESVQFDARMQAMARRQARPSGIEGVLQEVGTALYEEHDGRKGVTHYMKYKEDDGREGTAWGRGLPAALIGASAQPGDRIRFSRKRVPPEVLTANQDDLRVDLAAFAVEVLSKAPHLADAATVETPVEQRSEPQQAQANAPTSRASNTSQPVPAQEEPQYIWASSITRGLPVATETAPAPTPGATDVAVTLSFTDASGNKLQIEPVSATHVEQQLNQAKPTHGRVNLSFNTPKASWNVDGVNPVAIRTAITAERERLQQAGQAVSDRQIPATLRAEAPAPAPAPVTPPAPAPAPSAPAPGFNLQQALAAIGAKSGKDLTFEYVYGKGAIKTNLGMAPAPEDAGKTRKDHVGESRLPGLISMIGGEVMLIDGTRMPVSKMGTYAIGPDGTQIDLGIVAAFRNHDAGWVLVERPGSAFAPAPTPSAVVAQPSATATTTNTPAPASTTAPAPAATAAMPTPQSTQDRIHQDLLRRLAGKRARDSEQARAESGLTGSAPQEQPADTAGFSGSRQSPQQAPSDRARSRGESQAPADRTSSPAAPGGNTQQGPRLRPALDMTLNGFTGDPADARPRPPADICELLENMTYDIQRNKSVLYLLRGEPAFFDHGEQILMHKGLTPDSDDAVLAALLMAKEKWGGKLEITGTPEFQQRALALLVKHNLDVELKNPQQDAMRRQLARTAPDQAQEAPGSDPVPLMGRPAASASTAAAAASAPEAEPSAGAPANAPASAPTAALDGGPAAQQVEQVATQAAASPTPSAAPQAPVEAAGPDARANNVPSDAAEPHAAAVVAEVTTVDDTAANDSTARQPLADDLVPIDARHWWAVQRSGVEQWFVGPEREAELKRLGPQPAHGDLFWFDKLGRRYDPPQDADDFKARLRSQPPKEHTDPAKVVLRGLRKNGDKNEVSALLFKGDGDHLQGYLIIDGKRQPVIAHIARRAPDPDTGEVRPNYLRLHVNDGNPKHPQWREIGYGNPINHRSDGKPVYFDEMLLNVGRDILKVRVIASVDEPLHRSLGFIESRKQRSGKEATVHPREGAAPKAMPAVGEEAAAGAPRKGSRRSARARAAA